MGTIKVLITGPSLRDPGGVANYYNAVLPWLARSGIDARYVEIGSTHAGKSVRHIVRDQFRVWRAAGRLQPDIVHLNPSLDIRSFLRDGLFAFLARLRGRPVLVFFHGWNIPFEQHVEGSLRWFFMLTYLHASGYIVLSRHFFGKLREWGVRAPLFRETTAVSDASLSEFSLDLRLMETAKQGTTKLLYLARLERGKGVLELLEATLLLLGKGVDVTLTIAGEGAAMDEVRSRLLIAGDAAQHVTVSGYLRGSDKIAALQSHHIFCLPTQYGEGMPTSVLEAMGFGLPVITCPVGGIEDFFRDEEMGVLLQGNSPADIARAIERLLSDRGRLATIAKSNHEYARDNFLASGVARRLRGHYFEILGRQDPETVTSHLP